MSTLGLTRNDLFTDGTEWFSNSYGDIDIRCDNGYFDPGDFATIKKGGYRAITIFVKDGKLYVKIKKAPERKESKETKE
ncbi:MAG: hypothetical protein OXC46_00910 [Thaumarchaeota archaeon]|nr:hypothetical protein [Nitrososphaerota archaeon]